MEELLELLKDSKPGKDPKPDNKPKGQLTESQIYDKFNFLNGQKGADGLTAQESNYGKYLDPNRDINEQFVQGSNNDDYLTGDEYLNDLDINEVRAQRQTAGEKWAMGIGRVATKTLSEFGKGIGYIGGAAASVFTQDIETMTNNFFVNAFESMGEAAKEKMPVYVRNEITNGTFARQIWSPEFYVTEGADGLGFMISAIASGGAMGAISKTIGISGKVAELLGKGAKFAAKFDEVTIAGAQTFIESAAETKGVVDGLKVYWKGQDLGNGTYDSGKVDAEGNMVTYSQKEVNDLIGNAGVTTMSLNMFLLAGPNLIQTKLLFGKPTGNSNPFNGVTTGTVAEMQEQIAKRAPWKEATKAIVQGGSTSMAAESFQEWSQFSIENYADKKGKGLANKDLIGSLVDGYIEGLTTIEGQKSIFLGAVLGLGPGMVGAYKQNKAETAQAKGLLGLMSNSSQAFKDDITSVYKKDAEGNIELKDGNPVIDSQKMTELWNSVSEDMIQSKLYEQAKVDKDINAAKHSLREILTRNIYPYLGIEGGLELWKAHTRETSALLEGDAKSLGFDSKTELQLFMEELTMKVKSEYDNVVDKGPSFFGIESDILAKNKEEKKNIKQKIDQFVANLEYNAVRLKLNDDTLRESLDIINTDIAKFEGRITKSMRGKDTSIDNASKIFDALLKDDALTKIVYEKLLEKRKEIEKSITENGKLYESIFDKEEQQRAFNTKMDNENLIEKAEKEDAAAEDRNQLFKDFWHEMLASKGYNISSNLADRTNDFGKNTVTLRDNKGRVFRIEKSLDPETQSPVYKLRNMDWKQGDKIQQYYPLSIKNLKSLGLDGLDNILTKEEFQIWVRQKKIIDANENRLRHLQDLISDHVGSKYSSQRQVRELKEKLAKYSEDLEFWNNIEDATQDIVLDELIELEKLITETNAEIARLETLENTLDLSLKSLRQFQSELENIISDDNKIEFSFAVRLKELENRLLDGDFDLDMDLIVESIDTTKSILEEYYGVRDRLQDTFDDLSAILSGMNDIELLFDEGISNTLLDRILEVMPDIEIDGNAIRNLTKRQFRNLLSDKNTSAQFLSELKANKRELMSSYPVVESELSYAKEQIKELRKQLDKLNENKNLLSQYNTLDTNIKTLQQKNKMKADKAIEDGLSFNQNSRNTAKTEQSHVEPGEKKVRKYDPWTTITGIYETDENGNALYDTNPVTGIKTKRLSKNWKQSARWSKAISKIPIDKLSNYEVRFANSEQLGELLKGTNEDVPVVSPTALYAVIYNINTGAPISDGGLIYTGIAEPTTYFKNGKSNIDITRMPEYMPYFDGDEITPINPATFNNKEYTDRDTLIGDIQRLVEADYKAWKNELVQRLAEGKPSYSPISNISKGVARYSPIFRPVKDVLKVKSLRVARGTNMSNTNGRQGLIETEPGMVYAELENGQIHRVFNKKIGDLPETQKNEYLNRIISFMALANQLDSKDFNGRFKFTGDKVKADIRLFGNSSDVGIMDLFINWGRNKPEGASEYNDWGIAIYSKDKSNVAAPLEVRFDMVTPKGEKLPSRMDLADLFDSSGKIRDIRDPKLRPLATFLESKFMNVNYHKVGTDSKYGFRMPKGVVNVNGNLEIAYDKYPSFNDYVLEKSLVTNIEPYTEGTDKLPQFTNQYATFDRNIKDELSKGKAKVEPAKSAEPASTGNLLLDLANKGKQAPTASTGNKLLDLAAKSGVQPSTPNPISGTKAEAEFKNGPAESAGTLSEVEALFASTQQNKDFVEKEAPQEDLKEDCKVIKRPKPGKGKGGIKL